MVHPRVIRKSAYHKEIPSIAEVMRFFAGVVRKEVAKVLHDHISVIVSSQVPVVLVFYVVDHVTEINCESRALGHE